VRQLEKPWHALVSYHYFNTPTNARVIPAGFERGVRWIGDSGAFSAMTQGVTIDRDSYADWLHRYRGDLMWAASLDVIGDPAASLRHYRALTRDGFTVVPTIHFGTPAAELDRYAELGATFVGLGGVAARKDRPAVLRWLLSCFRYAEKHHPGMRFHGWGVTHPQYIAHLPFWSVDSSGFGAGYRYGVGKLFDPHTGRTSTVKMNGSHPGKVGELLRREYGLAPSTVATSHAGNRDLMSVMSALTAQLMDRHYTRRHNVSPPAGWEQYGPGTHVHFADSAIATYTHIFKALEVSP
jgi:hypothetical protein